MITSDSFDLLVRNAGPNDPRTLLVRVRNTSDENAKIWLDFTPRASGVGRGRSAHMEIFVASKSSQWEGFTIPAGYDICDVGLRFHANDKGTPRAVDYLHRIKNIAA
jgi:hypothetical protein